MSVYRKELKLCGKDENRSGCLRVSALFELLQELSSAHNDELLSGDQSLPGSKLLWVIARQRAEISRMPEYGETVTAETWLGSPRHALIPRYSRLLDSGGHVLVSVCAVWTLMDKAARTMVSTDIPALRQSAGITGNECAFPAPIARVHAENESLFTVPTDYADKNGHMNNARYFDLAESLIPAAAKSGKLCEASAEYSDEVFPGDTIKLSQQEKDGRTIISGRGEKKLFSISLEYEKITRFT